MPVQVRVGAVVKVVAVVAMVALDRGVVIGKLST